MKRDGKTLNNDFPLHLWVLLRLIHEKQKDTTSLCIFNVSILYSSVQLYGDLLLLSHHFLALKTKVLIYEQLRYTIYESLLITQPCPKKSKGIIEGLILPEHKFLPFSITKMLYHFTDLSTRISLPVVSSPHWPCFSYILWINFLKSVNVPKYQIGPNWSKFMHSLK